MKQKLLLKSLLLLFALIAGSSSVWADKEATFDFTNISEFSSWGNSYSEHSVTYDKATVIFASANKQPSTITNQPVTKGQPVSIVMNDGYTISDVSFTCTQWGTKAQTITLKYSTNGGEAYSTLSPSVTSSNFSISKSGLPTGTNAVQITFSSNNNQVGIASASITYSSSGGGDPTPTCDIPTFSPAGGTFISTQYVTISTETEGATIHYTIDGTDPTTSEVNPESWTQLKGSNEKGI